MRNACAVALAVAATGCPGPPAPSAPKAAAKPFAAATLTVACSDAATAAAVSRAAAAWAARSGAAVHVVAADPAAGVVVVPPTEIGALADARPLPATLTADDHPARWTRILATYRDRLSAWGPDVRGVPIAGEGYALAYRADLLTVHAAAFAAKYGRAPAAPATWEDIAEFAAVVAAATGKPSLPPLPAAPARLLREFHFVAACYDRPALTEATITRPGFKADADAGPRALSFHHDVTTGTPRLTAPGFVAAAAFSKRIHPLRMPGTADDPVAALTAGAVAAVLSFAEVGRLAGGADAVPEKFGLVPLPGTRTYFDAAGREQPSKDRGGNFVPYFGGGGFGVVRASCAYPDAAFDLLADLAGPARSLELLADPVAGFGPFRGEHLEQAKEGVWAGYRFDAARTKQLAESARRFAAVALANPAFAPRSPDQAELMRLLEAEVRKVAAGTVEPAAALAAAQAAWAAHDAKQPQAAEWRRKSAGLN